MIDLRNKCVLVRTQEEYGKLLKEAEKQGFKWNCGDSVIPFDSVMLPDVLKFYNDKTMILQEMPLVKADTLLGTKELTAREFIKYMERLDNCSADDCNTCVMNGKNTKCKKLLCRIGNWVGNEDELISIAKSGRITIRSKSIEVAEFIQDFIDNPDIEVTDDFIECLRFAADKLKEQEK